MIYKCYFNLTNELNHIQEHIYLDFECEKNALIETHNLACSLYNRYAGTNGLRTIKQIMIDNNLTYNEATEIYKKERENYIEYYVQEY